ncbi:unnamed protein product [Arctogadus glacialis]
MEVCADGSGDVSCMLRCRCQEMFPPRPPFGQYLYMSVDYNPVCSLMLGTPPRATPPGLTGPTLALPWPYTGPTLALTWPYTDPTLAQHWSYTGPTLALHWPYPGPTLALPWPYTGPTLALHWPYTGPILALHWRYTGPTLALYWPYTGLCLATDKTLDSGTVSQVLLYSQAVQHMILCLGDHLELRKID